MKVLIIGGGGREHALFWKLSQSPKISDIYISNNNGGIAKEHQLHEDILQMTPSVRRRFLQKEKFDFVVVGPEAPIIDGVFHECKDIVAVFSPSPACARLEGSKIFAKQFLKKFNIPTANSVVCTDYEQARQYIESRLESKFPLVIKYDGLAQGKGVTIAKDKEQALAAAHAVLFEKIFPSVDTPKILIEDFLLGTEVSLFLLCDGHRELAFPLSRDYKRAYDKQMGPNTGGMGAYAPVSVDANLYNKIQKRIIDPLMPAITQAIGRYRGLLYVGLMIYKDDPYVLEFNVRFGDPETQALLPIVEDDLLMLLYEASCGKFTKSKIQIRDHVASVTVVLAAEGYPQNPQKNIPLKIPTGDSKLNIFHAGTSRRITNEKTLSWINSGGRVLNINAVASDLTQARKQVYDYLDSHAWPGFRYVKDIALQNK